MKHYLNLLIALALPLGIAAQGKPNKYMGTPLPVADNQNKPPYEFVLNDPMNVRIYTLKNGLKIYLSVYKNAPRIQTYIAIKAGSKNDPAEATGLAHYLEHMVFKGTDAFGTKDFAKEQAEIKKIENLFETYRKTRDEAQRKKIYHQIDSISGVAAKYAIANEYDKMLAGLGADGTNAFTSFDQTVYVNDIPANQVGNWLKIEAERFRKPVLRLFHTELEAVYEEKNRGLDSDDNKTWEALFSGLFSNHTYGTQTTIGTIEHLKNPSMVEINKFYNRHYIPNNMAIIMSGDFVPEQVVAEIEKYFGKFESKPVEKYKFKPEAPITKKIIKEVTGPNPASLMMAWRLPGDGTREVDLANLLNSVLYNGTAGLMDIDLNQGQKVLSSMNFFFPLKDYSIFGFASEPKEGQALEDVEQLLLEQLEKIKKGDFPDWLIQASITDMKLRKTKELEKNASRADAMMNAFVNDLKWQDAAGTLERLSKISKQELVDFANKTFNKNNYVVVYKRTGEDKNVVKVEKPEITPVDVDRENSSQFVQDISNSNPKPIEPKYIDYEKDIVKTELQPGLRLLYNKNTENRLFELYYKFDMGSDNDKTLPVAIKYVPYLAAEGMSAAEIKQELYRSGCSFNVFSDNENVWVALTGLYDNFEKALSLFEKALSKPIVEESVLKNLIEDIKKERNDTKLQKNVILHRAMTAYARYGSLNPFSNVLSDEELDKLSAAGIKQTIASLLSFQHEVLFYGPGENQEILSLLKKEHKVPAQLKPVPAPVKFEEKQLNNTVFVADYDMTQAEIVMLSNGHAYNPAEVPVISLYNNYFGGGMSGVMFQDLRESKALAYSTFSSYRQPKKLSRRYFNFSYIGSQADKLSEAMKGLKDLLNNIPKADASFNAAKESIIQEMRTQRITKADIIFSYLSASELGNKTDIRKDIFEKVQNLTFGDIEKFHAAYIKEKSTTTLVLGKVEKLNMKELEKYGTVKVLTLKEIFGF